MCDEKYLYSRKLYVFILLTIMIPLILLNNKSIYAEERSGEGTAYAVLTNAGELIFFRSNDVYSEGAGQTAYDINGTRYYGRIYTEIETLNEELSRNVKWVGNRKSIKEVSIADGQLIRPVNCRYWFYECSNMRICNLKGLDTSRVKYMEYMFYGCSNLKTIDVGSLNTSNVIDMRAMFRNCSKLTELDVNEWDTRKVTVMFDMFSSCSKLKEINLGPDFIFNGSNISSTSNQATLPEPPYETTTGKWISYDNDYGPYTSAELRDNYSSEKYGKWTWEIKENPYAVFDNNTRTLKFIRAKEIHDNNDTGTVKSISGGEYTGKIFTVNETSTDINVFWSSIVAKVKKVQFVDVIHPHNTQSWFNGFSICTEMDLLKLDTSSVTNMSYMFNNCKKVTSFDISSFDTSNVLSMDHMFNGCTNITAIDISNFDVAKVTTFSCLFNDCTKLESIIVDGWNTENATIFDHMFNCIKVEKLDLSSFNTSSATNMDWMLTGMSSLKSITLGEDFIFKKDDISDDSKQAILPTPQTVSPYTGKWIREDEAYGPYTPEELRDNYTPAMAGTWVWQEKSTTYTITYATPPNTLGSMFAQKIKADEVGVLTPNSFSRFNCHFDHWEGNNGKTYIDKQIIPANTFNAGDTLILTAVFTKNDNSVNIDKGEFDITLHTNEKASFVNFPGGTIYTIYEETPSGWQLIDQINPSGTIPANGSADAQFMNEYVPGNTTVQLIATKTLDGNTPSNNAYTFELLNADNEVIETKTNDASGLVLFSPITIDTAGDKTYYIKEVRGEDPGINYDSHIETITVHVTDDGAGNLTATPEYDADGAKFANYTKPGMLTITKETDGNGTGDETFTFEIRLIDEYGRNLDNIDIIIPAT